ncbi:DUF4395 domain-containing protein [Pedobacter endophyticus]|uniref:DUF4395 domain-containing protein n=1 Tax=Pedobacter endophyticus TaxID=2789740 RepID=A0A7S9Q0R4_9SPHI|nr:DUF4395 domain-containing protein [Pedobacter endophyticus]QPH40987.1 DUF4395 domain-containing protein [Pedobacter endophyticus]
MELSCPVSAERINENAVRIIALMVALIAIACILFSNYWAMLFLIFDFAMRAFNSGKYSFLKFIALKVTKALNLKPKMTDMAPKKFAAIMGFAFCILIIATSTFSFFTAAFILTSVLIVFALLESLFGVCVGCYVYTFINLSKRNH